LPRHGARTAEYIGIFKVLFEEILAALD